MGSFTVQPSGVQAVHHPIKYIFSHNSTQPIESLRCVIEVKDGAITPSSFFYYVRIPYSTKVLVSGSTYTYTFNIDSSAFCKQKLPPFTTQVSTIFRFSNVNWADVDNGDFWVETRITAYPEYRNAQGQLVDDTGNAQSSYVRVIPAAYRRTDTKNLTAYTTGTTRSFLTKRPSGSTWCLNSQAEISCYFTGKSSALPSGYYYQLYWESTLGTYTYGIENISKFNEGQITLPLNNIFANLQANHPTVKQIRMRVWSSNGTIQNNITDYYIVNLDRNCCTGINFSWMNELGGVDNYAFCGEIEREFKVGNEYGQQYDDGITTRLKGIYKTNSEVQETIVIRDLLPAADVDWIKYILASHEVYCKIGSEWYNCVIEDAATITESNMLGMFEFSFTARLSDVVTNHN